MLSEKEKNLLQELEKKFKAKNYEKIFCEAIKPYNYQKELKYELNKTLTKFIFNPKNKHLKLMNFKGQRKYLLNLKINNTQNLMIKTYFQKEIKLAISNLINKNNHNKLDSFFTKELKMRKNNKQMNLIFDDLNLYKFLNSDSNFKLYMNITKTINKPEIKALFNNLRRNNNLDVNISFDFKKEIFDKLKILQINKKIIYFNQINSKTLEKLSNRTIDFESEKSEFKLYGYKIRFSSNFPALTDDSKSNHNLNLFSENKKNINCHFNYKLMKKVFLKNLNDRKSCFNDLLDRKVNFSSNNENVCFLDHFEFSKKKMSLQYKKPKIVNSSSINPLIMNGNSSNLEYTFRKKLDPKRFRFKFFLDELVNSTKKDKFDVIPKINYEVLRKFTEEKSFKYLNLSFNNYHFEYKMNSESSQKLQVLTSDKEKFINDYNSLTYSDLNLHSLDHPINKINLENILCTKNISEKFSYICSNIPHLFRKKDEYDILNFKSIERRRLYEFNSKNNDLKFDLKFFETQNLKKSLNYMNTKFQMQIPKLIDPFKDHNEFLHNEPINCIININKAASNSFIDDNNSIRNENEVNINKSINLTNKNFEKISFLNKFYNNNYSIDIKNRENYGNNYNSNINNFINNEDKMINNDKKQNSLNFSHQSEFHKNIGHKGSLKKFQSDDIHLNYNDRNKEYNTMRDISDNHKESSMEKKDLYDFTLTAQVNMENRDFKNNINKTNRKRKYFDFSMNDPNEDKDYMQYLQKIKIKNKNENYYIQNSNINDFKIEKITNNTTNKISDTSFSPNKYNSSNLNEKIIVLINRKSKNFNFIQEIFSFYTNSIKPKKQELNIKSNLKNESFSHIISSRLNRENESHFNNDNKNINFQQNLNKFNKENNSTFNKILFNKIPKKNNNLEIENSKTINEHKINKSFYASEMNWNTEMNNNSKTEENEETDFSIILKEKLTTFYFDDLLMQEIDLVVNLHIGIIITNFENIHDNYDNQEYLRILGSIKRNLFKYEIIKIFIIINSDDDESNKAKNKYTVDGIEFLENNIIYVIQQMEIRIKKDLEKEGISIHANLKNKKIPIFSFCKFSLNEKLEIIKESLGLKNIKIKKYKLPGFLNIETFKIEKFMSIIRAELIERNLQNVSEA